VWTSPFFKCLWFILTLLLAIVAIAVIIVLFLIFGAGWEFIKCYNESKNKKDEDDEDGEHNERNDIERGSITSSNVSRPGIKNKKKKLPENGENDDKKCNIYWMYALLLVLGLFVQPFYLLFKFIEILMECYRRYGCWFYYFGSY
jgi:hypothetical protein